MDHDELQQKFLKAFNGRVPVSARPFWSEFLKNRGIEFHMKYEWVKNKRFYQWMNDCEEIDWHDGGEGITIWIRQSEIVSWGVKG